MKPPPTLVLLLLLAASVPTSAQDTPLLGSHHAQVGYGAMRMQHVTFESDDAGISFRLAGYRHVGRDWYVGLDLVAGASLALIRNTSSIATVELNAKRAFALGDPFRLDLGGGLSYSRVHYDDGGFFDWEDDVDEIADSVLGVQALLNLNLKLDWFIVGWHVEYMLTQDVDGVQEAEGLDEGWDYSHLTLGMHVGLCFD